VPGRDERVLLRFAENLESKRPRCYVKDTTMKQLYKPALILFATYAVSALSIWTHG